MTPRSLHIGIDARLALHEPHGMGKYILYFVRELARMTTRHSFTLYTDLPDANKVFPAEMSVRVLNSKNYFIWEQFLLPRAVRNDNIDLLHCPANTAPLMLRPETALVMTIHDVMYLHSNNKVLEPGNLYQRFGAMYRRIIVPRAAKKASRVMTDSMYSRDEIVKFMPVHNLPIDIVYLGSERSAMDAVEQLKHRYGIIDSYIVAFGGIAPRKNTNGALRAFAELHKRFPAQLVVTSVPVHARKGFSDMAESLGIGSSVIFVDFLTDVELHSLIANAQLCLFLTLFEGFGLPVIESMQAGTPVVASDVTCIPEIAGGAALLVSPENIRESVHAMAKLLTDPNFRSQWVAKGLERALNFTWASTASQILECYEKASGGSRPA